MDAFKLEAREEQAFKALIKAVKDGNLEKVKIILELSGDSAGSIVNMKDEFGRTPLMYASEGHDIPVMDELLKHGAKVNVEDKTGKVPLFYALTPEFPPSSQTAQFLLNYGADVNYKNNEGKPLITEVVENFPHPAEAVLFLLRHKANPNVQDMDEQSRTPLSYAVERGDVDTTRTLLNLGADPNMKDGYGWPALFYANGKETINILKEAMNKDKNPDKGGNDEPAI